MRVWRLCRRAHAPFDGEGARRFGGRWNLRGTPLVYASGDAALAVLESFVHLELRDAPSDFVLIPADLPEALPLEEVHADELPPDWRAWPAPESLARLGTAWAVRAETVVLSVPSAIVPVGRNYLINPRHREFAAIQVGVPQPFMLDTRLFRKRRRSRGRRS